MPAIFVEAGPMDRGQKALLNKRRALRSYTYSPMPAFFASQPSLLLSLPQQYPSP